MPADAPGWPAWLADRTALAASQRRALGVAREWRDGDAYRALGAALTTPRCTAGACENDGGVAHSVADAAATLFADDACVGALLAPLIDALRDDAAFEPPLRVHRDALRIGAVLFETEAVSVTASVMSADALARAPAPRTLVVPGRVAVVRYHRGGGARLRCWRADEATADFSAADASPCRPAGERRLADGAVVRHDGRVEAHLLDRALADVVTLTATVRVGAAPVMREYALGDGRLLRVSALDDAQSRTQMLLTLLRVAGRTDAAAAFAAATQADGFHLRWAAMREWLALDVAAALPRLAIMATADPHAEVRAAAVATLPLARARFEVLACPA